MVGWAASQTVMVTPPSGASVPYEGPWWLHGRSVATASSPALSSSTAHVEFKVDVTDPSRPDGLRPAGGATTWSPIFTPGHHLDQCGRGWSVTVRFAEWRWPIRRQCQWCRHLRFERPCRPTRRVLHRGEHAPRPERHRRQRRGCRRESRGRVQDRLSWWIRTHRPCRSPSRQHPVARVDESPGARRDILVEFDGRRIRVHCRPFAVDRSRRCHRIPRSRRQRSCRSSGPVARRTNLSSAGFWTWTDGSLLRPSSPLSLRSDRPGGRDVVAARARIRGHGDIPHSRPSSRTGSSAST